MTRTDPVVTFFLIVLLNLATLAPFVSPSALYPPQLVIEGRHIGIIYVIAMAVASGYLLWGAIRVVHCATAHASRFVRPLVGALLILVSFMLTGAAAFYAKLGAYPGPVVVSYVVTDLADCVDYVRSSGRISDALVLLGTAATIIGLSVAVTRRVWREPAKVYRGLGNIVLATALLWAFRDAPVQTGSIRFLIAEHSTPMAKYLYGLTSLVDSNRIDVMRAYVPRAVSAGESLPISPARHVLLIVAECLRADRLPVYGYARNTTPFIQSESDKWVVFTHAYAHGPSTADNFPIMFNARYFAAVDRSNEGASALWRFLRDRGTQSAFLSAGAMEWAGIRHSLDLSHTDYEIIASKADGADLRKNSESQFDYGLDDSIPLHRYLELLDTTLAGRDSFAVMHFVGSHFPFQYEDTPDAFVPSLRRSVAPAARPQEDRRHVQHGNIKEYLTDSAFARISNSFDNSIVHIDGLVRQAVQALERLGILEDSVVVVTSDHGESLGEHRTLFHGTSLYEEQVHVPLIIRVGSHLEDVRTRLQSRRAGVAGQVDLMPTVLHLLSGREPAVGVFEGTSLLSTARKQYELLLYRGIGEKVALVTDDRKYIFDLQGRGGEEYALNDDPAELRNLWQGHERNITQFTSAVVGRGVLQDAASRR